MKIETSLSGEDMNENRNSQHTGWKESLQFASTGQTKDYGSDEDGETVICTLY